TLLGLLIDQGHDAGERGRGKGRSSCGLESERVERAPNAARVCIGLAEEVEAVTEALSSEEGHVRHVARPVSGHAVSRLPGRFGISPITGEARKKYRRSNAVAGAAAPAHEVDAVVCHDGAAGQQS